MHILYHIQDGDVRRRKCAFTRITRTLVNDGQTDALGFELGILFRAVLRWEYQMDFRCLPFKHGVSNVLLENLDARLFGMFHASSISFLISRKLNIRLW